MPSKSKMSDASIFTAVKARFGALIATEDAKSRMPHLVLSADGVQESGRFAELMTFCRDDASLRFDLLSAISGVDYPDRGVIEVLYFLDSTEHTHRLVFKVALPRANPRIPTVEDVWRTADWHERETFDLLGVRFVGHHNLVRILCAEDWVGHPLRKDYVIPDEYHGIKNIVY
jgi:NADH-quinone oxidoreductase subunit C